MGADRGDAGAARCPSLDGRRFVPVANVEGGEVGPDTTFEYHQDGDVVWARYGGGSIRLGLLVGSRTGDEIAFRYVQLHEDGETASGRCRSRLELLPDGRITMREDWSWEARPGSGTSTVEELIA